MIAATREYRSDRFRLPAQGITPGDTRDNDCQGSGTTGERFQHKPLPVAGLCSKERQGYRTIT